MSESKSLVWLRNDLRLQDNPALFEAAKMGYVLPVYILDTLNPGEHTMGGASKLWLHYSLKALNESLDGNLVLYSGDPLMIIPKLIQHYKINNVYWNRCYEPWAITRDKQLKAELMAQDIMVKTFNASLLWEPWESLKKDGTPYRVFTPFYKRGCLNAAPPRQPLPKAKIKNFITPRDDSVTIEKLKLLPTQSWGQVIIKEWNIGEYGAQQSLKRFIKKGMPQYKAGRDHPSLNAVSRLSPHIHFGEISINTIWHTAYAMPCETNRDHFLSELGWREFSYNLLYYNPDLPHNNLQNKFDRFPWDNNKKYLKAWQQGLTGYPIVDAGMRELYQTGYMHNRVRMIVGSFLVKNLLLHWHHGEQWFWDCLFDADLASNSASWQWVAGTGADAAPYFRIFNPVTQGKKFDADGQYTKRFVPELKDLPDKYLFNPWEAPKEVLEKANLTLGKNYPMPIIDLKPSREKALAAFSSLKEQSV